MYTDLQEQSVNFGKRNTLHKLAPHKTSEYHEQNQVAMDNFKTARKNFREAGLTFAVEDDPNRLGGFFKYEVSNVDSVL